MDENFSVLSDPDFLALRRRVREELEHTPEHEISPSLAARYARLDEEFLRRASLAWTQTANGLGETTMSELAALHPDTARLLACRPGHGFTAPLGRRTPCGRGA